MVQTFLLKLHDLCHDYEVHKNQIKGNKQTNRIFNILYQSRLQTPEDMDKLFSRLHEVLHQNIGDSHRGGDRSYKDDKSAYILKDIQLNITAMLNLLENVNAGVQQVIDKRF